MSSWTDCKIVFVIRPCCPHCGHERHLTIRSMPRESDGSKTLRCVCTRCSGRYLIVTEVGEPDEDFEPLPDFGKHPTLAS